MKSQKNLSTMYPFQEAIGDVLYQNERVSKQTKVIETRKKGIQPRR